MRTVEASLIILLKTNKSMTLHLKYNLLKTNKSLKMLPSRIKFHLKNKNPKITKSPPNKVKKKYNLKRSLLLRQVPKLFRAFLIPRMNLFKVKSNLKKILKFKFQVELVKVLNQNLSQQEAEAAEVEHLQEARLVTIEKVVN